ncbi:S-adenosyl-L-methionine-dependent methyltransferase [Scheffersomyces coipomensis]|uniref:S-adenosyl-L-methionine-dependent methyltransferase n=1 Tax=Scheffersomyces coipomensis TaxID=1788519 RepID=UPI00315DF879
MSDLHDLCKFPVRPIDSGYVKQLNHYLTSGIPATYTVEEAYKVLNNIEDDDENSESVSNTTPLHLICQHVPKDLSSEELSIVEQMITTLFEYGAGWCFIDVNNNTPGCILIERGFHNSSLYQLILDAGVRAELLLRKVSEYDMEFIDEDDVPNQEDEVVPELVTELTKEQEEIEVVQKSNKPEIDDAPDAPSQNQDSYLNTKLEYVDNALITKDRKDGVMMSWESDLMKLGCDSLFKGSIIEENEIDSEINILNIGFGMGIIDTMIQAENPTKHYICEAHPDVLKKLRDDGWYEKSNVVILEGRWQDQLDDLLTKGIFFNGIYYDTFSEHYSDMLDLFDFVVGLLKPYGIFSFFNGLGADRQIIYEVYKKLVDIDLQNYGLSVTYTDVEVPKETLQYKDKSVWDDVKRSYWSCPVYYHPEAKFIEL